EFLKENPELSRYDNLFESTPKELSSIGTFKTNNSALLVAKMKPNLGFKIDDEYVIALDGINDPGNMGAIIRIADWYGINKIVASEDTVDFYNPKVIAASKGSFNRVRVFYTDLIKYFDAQKVDVFGASMKGQNIHSMSFPNKGIIVMGNEANGISTNLDKSIHYKITIPRFGAAESLNVAMATSIICDNVFRAKS
ncbi:MAG: RNA methyltransferase, partial [Bacteroidota bacterium]